MDMPLVTWRQPIPKHAFDRALETIRQVVWRAGLRCSLAPSTLLAAASTAAHSVTFQSTATAQAFAKDVAADYLTCRPDSGREFIPCLIQALREEQPGLELHATPDYSCVAFGFEEGADATPNTSGKGAVLEPSAAAMSAHAARDVDVLARALCVTPSDARLALLVPPHRLALLRSKILQDLQAMGPQYAALRAGGQPVW